MNKFTTFPSDLKIGDGTASSIWPATHYLTRHLLTLNPSNMTVLELGCGFDIPSICMYHLGNAIVCQDLPLAEHNLRLNMKANDVEEYTWLPCDWHNDEECKRAIAQLPKIDLIIASDIFYEERDFSAIIRFVCRGMARHETTECIICYHHRDVYHTIAHDLELWGLGGEVVGQEESWMILKIKNVY